MRLVQLSVLTIFFWLGLPASAHPAGNMIEMDGQLFWTYICPVGEVRHRACIMMRDRDGVISPWLRSSHDASDWFFAPGPDGSLHLVESRFEQADNNHYFRLLKARPGGNPVVLQDWQDDSWRFGASGFAVRGDGTYLFARHSRVMSWKPGDEPAILSDDLPEASKLRAQRDGSALLIGDGTVWQIDGQGNRLREWSGLAEDVTRELPFMGNRIWSASLDDGELAIAWWGQYRCDLIYADGKRSTLRQFDSPWLPYLVEHGKDDSIWCLASSLNAPADGQIKPQLWRFKGGRSELVWEG